MTASVVVVGGGYAGAALAHTLDATFDVCVVEAKDTFFHSVAALRGLTQDDWAQRIFLDYSGLLERGQVIRDRAVRVDSRGVRTASGRWITADFVVLASGSSYPFPAKMDVDDSGSAIARLTETRADLEAAGRVLLLGAGPVGVELAGEILEVWPDKQVTIVDAMADVLSGRYLPELRGEIRAQLGRAGVRLVLGSPLVAPPAPPSGRLARFEVSTAAGTGIPADIWFQCYGVRPQSDYLVGDLSGARRADGQIDVDEHLRLPGHHTVFAIGDVSVRAESKRVPTAREQASVVAANIAALAAGRAPGTTYRPGRADLIVLPFGSAGGASQLEGADGVRVVGAERTSELKGRDLFLGQFAQMFAPPARDQTQPAPGATLETSVE